MTTQFMRRSYVNVAQRPDLHCTNGYIHVIDTVLMRDRDVSISAAETVAPHSVALALSTTSLMLRFFV